MSRFFATFFTLAFIFSSVPVFAQESASTTPPLPTLVRGPSNPTGPLNCFDYYTFGSVQADLQPTLNQTVPGATLTFTGEVKNANAYPLLDGTLYVKIFKRDEGTFAEGDGNIVADQFVVKDGIMLPGNGSTKVAYEWQVPLNAEGGEYYAAYFFTTAKRYNLMGLSFTDDVVGNQAPFTIAADNVTAKLSKVDTTLNGQNHHFAAFPLHFEAGDTVTMKTTITNPSDQPKTLPLQWNQYAWDAMLEDNLRFTKTELVTLAPNETKEVIYEAQPQRESVVYVVAVTQDNEAKSILNTRFVRDGIEETRINFPGLTSFPIQKDQDNTLFACAHSTNLPVVPGNTLTLTLTDRDGNTIHQYKYEGDIAGEMSGFGDVFKTDKNINYAVLTATLERNGVTVEQVTQTFDCAVIDPNSCLPETGTGGGSLFDMLTQNFLTSILSIVIVLLLLAVILFVYKKRHNHIDAGPTMTTPTAFLFFLLLLPSVFFMHPGQTEAKSVGWSTTNNPELWYYWNWGGSTVPGGSNGWQPGLAENSAVTVSYAANLVNADTAAPILDNDTLPAGTRITCSMPYSNADISWNGTGLSGDSPNGTWIDNAASPADYCAPGNLTAPSVLTGGNCGNEYYSEQQFASTYTALNVHRPASTCAFSGTASVSQIDTDTWQVNSGGTVIVTATFPQTYGKYYYGYVELTCVYLTGCVHNDTPMTRESNLVQTVKSWPPFGNVAGYYGDANPPSSVAAHQLVIPEQSITFTLNAISSNNPPATPTITGPATGITNTSYGYTIGGGTDPDGDQVRYGIADASCTTVTQWLPGSGYFTPGSQAYNISWVSPNTYTIKVFSEDSKGARSGCATQTITIAAAPVTTADLKVNGSDTSINVAKNATVNLTWSSENAASCSKWGGTWGSGQAIALDNTSPGVNVAVTATTTFMVNCGGVSDSVTVNVKNQKPNPPTITYVSGTKETGKTITYAIQGTDSDSDNVFYEVDWMDGTPLATTMTVPSNTAQNANHSWGTDGPKTFRARTVDTAGARSDWTTHDEVIALAIPSAPTSVTATCPIPGTSLAVSWPAVSGATSYNYRIDNQSNSWEGTCSPTNQGDSCQDGFGGTSVNKTGIPGSYFNIWVHACNSAGCSAATDITTPVQCIGLPDLTRPEVSSPTNGTFDTVSNTYTDTTITFNTQNDGMSGTGSTADYLIEFDLNQDGDFADLNEQRSSVNGLPILSNLAPNNDVSRTVTIPGPITFGVHRLRITVDSSGNPGKVTESNENNNVYDSTITVLPPDPGLSLTADKTQVRNGDTATITWNVTTRYPMTCTVTGPGVNSGTFNPETAALAASDQTDPVTAKSEYTMRCTDMLTPANTWTDTVTVGSVGEVEEI